MSATRRILQEPAWLLHHRPFRDTSRILDVLSRAHGRVSMVARGSRSARSRLGGILRPFLPLRLSWVGRGDLGTLTGAELDGAPLRLDGDALLSAYYVNELLLYLLHKDDPQPDIFDLYRETILRLAAAPDVTLVLRQFEMALLRMLGYALNLAHDARTHRPVEEDCWYEYRPEHGSVAAVDGSVQQRYSGAQLLAIQAQRFGDPGVLHDAGRLLRDVVAYHLGGKELKSRKVLIELKRTGKETV